MAKDIEEAKRDDNYRVVKAKTIDKLQEEVNKLTNSKNGYRPIGSIRQDNDTGNYLQILFKEDGTNEGKQLLFG